MQGETVGSVELPYRNGLGDLRARDVGQAGAAPVKNMFSGASVLWTPLLRQFDYPLASWSFLGPSV